MNRNWTRTVFYGEALTITNLTDSNEYKVIPDSVIVWSPPLKPDNVNAGGPLKPDNVNAGGPLKPDNVNAGGPLKPDNVNAGGPLKPDNVNAGGSLKLENVSAWCPPNPNLTYVPRLPDRKNQGEGLALMVMKMAASVFRKLALTSVKLQFSSKVTVSLNCQKRSFCFSRCLADHFYTDKHEWVVIEKGKGTVGISNYAQEQLGEIVYVETPAVGTELNPQDVAGCLESVKAASEVYSPVGGTVTEINSRLSSEPALVNSSPLLEGWLYKMDVAPGTNTKGLMDEKAYQTFIGSLDSH
ncbi:hypothetical protein Btru_011602 [Bulinus truncatus]|nr:hypothetical protein Btru_011602 [Bulinus truncatus]